MFSDKGITNIRKSSEKSKNNIYEDDYIVNFIEGSKNFDFGLDTLKCPINEFFKKENAGSFMKNIK